MMALLEHHIQVTLEDLEENRSNFKLHDYISSCENAFDDNVEKIALKLRENDELKTVFISGPSASGKTTFTDKLSCLLNKDKIETVKISLDDYYFSHEFVTDEFGRHNYESISTLDTELLVKQLNQLISGETVRVPHFNFLTKTRDEINTRDKSLPTGGVLLVEGLHGLATQIAGAISAEKWLGVFIMPYATLTDDYTLLDSRDIRILRRVARDSFTRGADALSTIDYWPMLDHTEIDRFPEYLANADIYINSAIPYEFYCVAPLAGRLIAQSVADYHEGIRYDTRLTSHNNFAQIDEALELAGRLVTSVWKIPFISTDMIPEGSLLNEFIKRTHELDSSSE